MFCAAICCRISWSIIASSSWLKSTCIAGALAGACCCGTGGGTGGPSPDPSPTGNPPTTAGTSTGTDSGTTTQLVMDDGTVEGSVAVTYTASSGSATATVGNACAGTVYWTGLLAAG